MAMAATTSLISNPSYTSHQNPKSHFPKPSSFNPKQPTTYSTKFPTQTLTPTRITPIRTATSTPPPPPQTTNPTTFHGLCYILGNNIDTDQIIPAEYLTLVPLKPDEYKKLNSYALIALPSTYTTHFIAPGETQSKYNIVIVGENFGCGSSREHALVALGEAGVKAVVAESYARIFFRNSVATGEVYPLESEGRLCEECKTGDVVTIELGGNLLINHTNGGKEYMLKPIGDAGPVIDASGIFAYARKSEMIPSAAPTS